MNPEFVSLVGWVFALIYVGATLLRLFYILVKRDPAQVVVTYWLLMGVANLCLYLYIEKLGAPQAIVGLLGTAVLDFIIAAITISQRRDARQAPEQSSLEPDTPGAVETE